MNKIKAICEKKGLSYAEVARKAGVTPMYVGLLAKEERKNPSLKKMQKIALALGEKTENVFDMN